MSAEASGVKSALRPTASRALVIAIGVAAWVPFAFLLVGLVVTDGSYWSLLFALIGLGAAWMRARTVAVWRNGRPGHSVAWLSPAPAVPVAPS
jgi:hypothetical protein